MKSRANIKSHPIHPILVCFPIAFYTGTLIFDLLGFFSAPQFYYTALNLEIAALCSAAVAAIPGIVDYTFTVPPDSSAKKRGARHGLLNTAVLLLFGAALYYRLKNEEPNIYILLTLESAGFILLLIAGWLGGTLVYRNQIGVDPRYADAGRWKEEYLSPENNQVEIQYPEEIKLNQMRLIHTNGKRVVVARTEQGLVAFEDRCTHKGGSLAGGAMICGTVQCPWHGSQFKVTDGSIAAGPAKQGISVYTIRESNGKVYLIV